VEDTDPCGRNLDTGLHPHGTREAQEYVRDRKLEELRSKPAVPAEPDTTGKPWKNFGEMRRVFEQLREQVGETRYLEELELAGVQNPAQFLSAARPWPATGAWRGLPRNRRWHNGCPTRGSLAGHYGHRSM